MLLAVAGRRHHLRVGRDRGRGDPSRGGERPAGGEADARGGRRTCGTTTSCAATGGSARPSPASSPTRASAFVVVDINPASLERAARRRAPRRRGRRDRATRRSAPAGIERARGLITTIDSDANNVYVTLSARAINPGLFIVARANAEGSEAKLAQAGADRIVSPYTHGRAARSRSWPVRPRVADFIDAALSHGDLAFSMEEVEVDRGEPAARA